MHYPITVVSDIEPHPIQKIKSSFIVKTKNFVGATVKEITTGVGKASPHTTKVVHDGIDMVKNETSKVTEKVVKGIKNQQTA